MHPLLAVALFQVCLQRAVYRLLGVYRLVYPLAPDLRQPELERLGLRRGYDWMMRSSCSVSATSVRRFLPSAAVIFKP